MAIIDSIGVPFPATHPLFASDRQLQKKIVQAENLIELFHDMSTAVMLLDQLKKLFESKQRLFDVGIDAWGVGEGLASAAVLVYAKAFVESKGRTHLDPDEVFGKSRQSFRRHHEFFMDLRHKLFAHHELEANRHQLFVIPESDGKPLRLHPYGQTERWIASASIDWSALRSCVDRASQYLRERISGLCHTIEASLSEEQRLVINKTSSQEMFMKYWRSNPNQRKHPLSKRQIKTKKR